MKTFKLFYFYTGGVVARERGKGSDVKGVGSVEGRGSEARE